MASLKLTKPQMAFLELVRHRSQTASPDYKPVRKLVELGLVDERLQGLGNPIYDITIVGISVLNGEPLPHDKSFSALSPSG